MGVWDHSLKISNTFRNCHSEVTKSKCGKIQVHQNHFHQKKIFIKIHIHQKPLSSKTTFIKNQFHQKTTFIKKPLSSKTSFIKDHFHQKTTFIRNHFHQKPFSSETTSCQIVWLHTVNIVRVCVKASPAEGWRRLHTNTAYARFSGFNGPSCEASPAEGRRCFT